MERYSLEQAQEEAGKMQEIVASGEVRGYRGAEAMVMVENEELEAERNQKNAEKIALSRKEDEMKIAELREKILNTGKNNEVLNEDTKKFERNFKVGLENISNQSKTMLDALYERQQERLTPLQSNENFQIMASSIKKLNNFEGKIDIDSISKIIEEINRISTLFDDIKIKPSGQVKENPQNLEKLAFGAKKFSASCEEGKNGLPIEMVDKQIEEKSNELRVSLQRLSEQTTKLWLLAAKLRDSIR
jgi:hypothetical protein